MRKNALPFISLLLVISMPSLVLGATISVCSTGCDYTTIQAAYNTANDGDVVEIRDSRTYTELITMNDDATDENPITLQAQDGQTPTIAPNRRLG